MVSLDQDIAGIRVRIQEIQRIYEASTNITSLNQAQIQFHQSDLEGAWKEYRRVYFDICTNWDEIQRTKHQFFIDGEFDAARKQFDEARFNLHSQIQSSNASISSRETESINGESQLLSSAGRLGRIDPPTFSFDRTLWLSYKHTFESMVVNTRFSNTDKLNYLKKSLIGSVACILRGLPASETNFERGWKELCERYDNVYLLKQCHVRALLAVRPVSRTNNIQEYERVLNEVQEQLMPLEDLGCKISEWGEMLLGEVMSKFDEAFLFDWEREVSRQSADKAKIYTPKYDDFKRFVWRHIEKMFRQILVSEQDSPYQCILWRPPDSNEISTFRLTTVTYGTASAPYLSMRVLRQLAIDESQKFPNVSACLLQNTYVDDVAFGADSIEQCRLIRDELISLLRGGGFLLRKWESNANELLNDLPEDLRARSSGKEFDEISTKILGVHWRRQNDSFSFVVKTQKPSKYTKRSILSLTASIFDPLGWISPTVVKAKIFLQKLWRKELAWDDKLPDKFVQEWSEYFEDLPNLEKLTIPRWTGLSSNSRIVELHGFADASTVAYAAVIYLKCETSEGTQISLLTSKTRVAPTKELSIPRLELLATVLLAELLAKTKRILNLENTPCYCWTDSSIVLSWLQMCPSKLKRFVAARVWKIHEELPNQQWRHVPTDCNHADAASRGLSPSEIISHNLWWSGPSWMSSGPENWPSNTFVKANSEVLELRTNAFVVQTVNPLTEIAARLRLWPRLLRLTAFVRRSEALFLEKKQAKLENRKISYENLPSLCKLIQHSKEFWLKHLQSESFSTEIKSLRKNLPLKNSKLATLDPFLDEVGLLRAGGRLKNAELLPFSVKHPIILSSGHITGLIVQSTHQKTIHGGVQLVLRVLREEYWILQARKIVRKYVNECVKCPRYKATICNQKMGELPSVRVTPSRTFEKTGVDYAGPFLTRASPGRGRATQKGYIAVFVCLTTRAIHLDLVSDYTSAAFFAAFRRFVSRNGLLSTMMSDNGTTFQGAACELREAVAQLQKDENLQTQLATDGVEWKLIPAGSPHFGGIWEAGVKSVKHHLKRVINNQTLTFEEMYTLLTQISACLNSRPIAPMSDHIDDFSYLTPGHFLGCNLPTAVPEPEVLNETRPTGRIHGEMHLTRWKRVQHMRNQFWRTWRSDYLLQLQMRRKWQKEKSNLSKGDIVLIRNELLPPCKWELGRVIKCFPGKDNLVRVVQIKTANSVFNRGINKVCWLPVRNTAEDSETS